MQVNGPEHWSRSQLEPAIKCPACGSAKRTSTVFEHHDNDGSMPDRWCMVQCGDCQSLRLDQRPDAQSPPRAYDSYYKHNAEPEEIKSGTRGLTWKPINGYLNQRSGMHRQPAPRWGTLLRIIHRNTGSTARNKQDNCSCPQAGFATATLSFKS